ncbi:MAG: hypothetical protein ACR2RF_23325 [Geminicoccaceae bacterium]
MMTLHPTRRHNMSLLKLGLLGLMGLSLAGCQELIGDRNTEGAANVEDKIRNLNSGAIEERIREVAIPVSDDLLMIPTGLDDDGCETFKPHSVSGNPVRTAIYYRQSDGGFGITRDPAVCKVEMISMGPDDDGCERYRAVPTRVDLVLENEVTYYRSADGGYSAMRPRDSCS